MNQMARDIKFLPTYYNGIEFRSRLEARWSVFFDCMKISYRYEYLGFDLDDIWYVPDYYIPNQRIWIEIKPVRPSEEEQEKCKRLAKKTKVSTYCFWDIPRKSNESDDGPAYAWKLTGGFNRDSSHNFIQCHECGAIRIDLCEDSDTYCHRCGAKADDESPQLKMAREVAKGVRFDDFRR